MLRHPMNHRSADQRERGFTLIELLVVVLIIGILVGIAIPIFLNQRQKAALSTLQADVRNATTATETYNTTAGTNGIAFGPITASTALSDGTTIVVSNGNTLQGWIGDKAVAGYCIKGSSTKTGGKVVYFDSSTGSQATVKPGAGTVCGTATGVS